MTPTKQITIRLDTRVLERATKLTDAFAAQTGRSTTTVDVLREAIVRGLRDLEKGAR
jgi:predicted DNA-binding protein